MTQSPLTRCPNCGDTLTMRNVTGQALVDEQFVAVGMVCGRCHQASHLKVKTQDWRQMLEAHGQKQPTDTPPEESESTVEETRTGPDPRQIGRVVKAFAQVDLAPILTVADIQLYWDDQERHDWASVPKERI